MIRMVAILLSANLGMLVEYIGRVLLILFRPVGPVNTDMHSQNYIRKG